MDPVAEQRIQTIMRQWQEMERGLESEIVLIKEDVCKAGIERKELKQKIEDTKQRVEDVETKVKNIKRGKNDTKILLPPNVNKIMYRLIHCAFQCKIRVLRKACMKITVNVR